MLDPSLIRTTELLGINQAMDFGMRTDGMLRIRGRVFVLADEKLKGMILNELMVCFFMTLLSSR